MLGLTCLAVLAALAVATGAPAEYPERVVMILARFPAGGTTDILERLVADRTDERLGRRFIVENPGVASGGVGTQAVAGRPQQPVPASFSMVRDPRGCSGEP